ncbi:hypothetical protein [Comamonas suwonensis]|uniref:hypothetical protein n=1 Tax=Comamonas suwonensis TaxID=2606214 RepID=UPI00145CF338|nr:hypothetical protein [Comamonas suwonensis]MBI1624939.1 hypothetical protein [Comamonas suwonensis]
MKTKNTITKISSIIAVLFCTNANAGTGMGMDSTSIIPLSELAMKPISNANKYIAPTHTAPPPQVNGKCGSDNSVTVYVTPTGLCSVGVASAVIISGSTYSWVCSGWSGGTSASCSANQYIAPPPPPPPTCQKDFNGPLPPCPFFTPAPLLCTASGYNIQWFDGYCGYKP